MDELVQVEEGDDGEYQVDRQLKPHHDHVRVDEIVRALPYCPRLLDGLGEGEAKDTDEQAEEEGDEVWCHGCGRTTSKKGKKKNYQKKQRECDRSENMTGAAPEQEGRNYISAFSSLHARLIVWGRKEENGTGAPPGTDMDPRGREWEGHPRGPVSAYPRGLRCASFLCGGGAGS